MFVMAAAVFGTFLTTFAVVFNNHLPGAVCAVVGAVRAVRIWFDGERRWRYFALVGLFGGLLVADELPALSLAAALGWRVAVEGPAADAAGLCAGGRCWWRPASSAQTGSPIIACFRPTCTAARPTIGIDYTYERNGRQWKATGRIRRGIDRGEPSRAVYALHVLVGHHGIFSLTPVWLLSVAGTLIWLLAAARPAAAAIGPADRRRCRWSAWPFT